ncbi:MAG: YbaB/EbfC family nucleoid-associated protein [Alphaproteobacteria bacterium]|nr:YbaB/EbfC family nucleoid-associated protein [Alphaproteobacteria bacterium]
MLNIGNMMKQVTAMQSKMADMQNKLAEMEITGQSGGSKVSVVINGKSELKKISIDSTLLVPEEKEMLEDLIVAAMGAAKQQADSIVAKETEAVMGGIKLPPGIKLPM